MQEHDKPEFAKRMTWLRSLYPGAPAETVFAAYWKLLRGLSWEAVDRAIGKAPRISPQWFPSGGMLLEAAEAEQRAIDVDMKHRQRQRALPPAPAEPPAPPRGLEREFIDESCRLGLDPDAPVPPDVAQRRLARIMEQYGIGNGG